MKGDDDQAAIRNTWRPEAFCFFANNALTKKVYSAESPRREKGCLFSINWIQSLNCKHSVLHNPFINFYPDKETSQLNQISLPMLIQHSTVWSSKPFTFYCPQRFNVASIECINSSACCSISVWYWVYLSILSTPLTLTYPAAVPICRILCSESVC